MAIPMSHEETCRLVALAQQGDINSRNSLILANLGLVYRIARRYSHLPFEDLVQEGIGGGSPSYGLIRAIEKFDVNRNCQFSTYASAWIRKAMTGASKRLEILSTNESMPDLVDTYDFLACIDDSEQAENLMKAIEALPYMLSIVIRRRLGIIDGDYLTPQSRKEVAALLGTSVEWVRQLENKAIKKLQNYLAKSAHSEVHLGAT